MTITDSFYIIYLLKISMLSCVWLFVAARTVTH